MKLKCNNKDCINWIDYTCGLNKIEINISGKCNSCQYKCLSRDEIEKINNLMIKIYN